jgi:VIT1/CCC1 family predicted Fe2+/Mn2+ transporter
VADERGRPVIERLLGDEVQSPGRYLAEAVYGANDGIVTTFAVVSGVAGAALDARIVVVLGVANLLADGFSMGMSNFLSRRSEMDYRETVAPGESRADDRSPARTAFATFAAFVLAGWTPLAPYLLGLRPLFPLSVATTAVVFFVVGASRSLVTDRPWPRNGVEMLVVGMTAAAVAFGVGWLLRGVA